MANLRILLYFHHFIHKSQKEKQIHFKKYRSVLVRNEVGQKEIMVFIKLLKRILIR